MNLFVTYEYIGISAGKYVAWNNITEEKLLKINLHGRGCRHCWYFHVYNGFHVSQGKQS